jgi:hypothetical protein
MLFEIKSLPWQARKNAIFAVVLGLIASAVATPALAVSLVLNWSDTSTNETGFKIERTPSGGSFSQIATVGTNVQTYTDANVVEGSSYCYRVSAYNSYGTSAPSNSACAQAPTSSSGSSSTTTTTGSTSTGTTSSSSTSTSTPSVTYIGSKWKNYKLSLSMKPQNGGEAGVMFRYLDSDNYYRLVWDTDTKALRLELRSAGDLRVLATRSNNLPTTKFHTLAVEANGSAINVTLNGKAVMSVSDDTLDEGQVALYTSSSPNTNFDDVVVTDLQTGATLLQESFGSNALSGWTIIDEAANGPSSWSVSNGALTQTSAIGSSNGGDSFGTFALYTQGSWTDYRFSLTMKSTDDDAIGVMFRFKDDRNYYRFAWDKQSGFRRLEKRVNGTFTTLATSSTTYTVGQSYSVTVLAQGTKLQVSIDGQLIFSVTDSALSRGTVGLYTNYNSGATFDNVMVEDLKSGGILLWDNFNDGITLGWTIIDDQGTQSGPSNWFVTNGALLQNSNIGSSKLGTFVLY